MSQITKAARVPGSQWQLLRPAIALVVVAALAVASIGVVWMSLRLQSNTAAQPAPAAAAPRDDTATRAALVQSEVDDRSAHDRRAALLQDDYRETTRFAGQAAMAESQTRDSAGYTDDVASFLHSEVGERRIHDRR